MKKLFIVVILLLVAGCIPTTAQINTLTNDIDKLMASVDDYQVEFAEEVDRVQEHIVVINDAVKEKADESTLEQIKAGWEETKDFNPYYAYGALVLTILGEGAALLKANKKSIGLEKGLSRVKGEAEPELAKKIHDTMKIYTG
jgi:gas vesicle protein